MISPTAWTSEASIKAAALLSMVFTATDAPIDTPTPVPEVVNPTAIATAPASARISE